jgi:hypothetical protein
VALPVHRAGTKSTETDLPARSVHAIAQLSGQSRLRCVLRRVPGILTGVYDAFAAVIRPASPLFFARKSPPWQFF